MKLLTLEYEDVYGWGTLGLFTTRHKLMSYLEAYSQQEDIVWHWDCPSDKDLDQEAGSYIAISDMVLIPYTHLKITGQYFVVVTEVDPEPLNLDKLLEI